MLWAIKTSCFERFFCENKNLNLEHENSFSEIASFRSVHDDMSAKPYDNCTMIMVSYADLWLMHYRVASQVDGVKLELRELKAHSSLLGACTSCLLLISNLEASAVEIKDLKHKLEHHSHYSVLSFRVNCVVLSSVSFSMLPKRTLS
jgi:hypothetical protein